MRQLVLHHAAGEAVKLLRHLLQILVVVLDLDLCRTSHFRIYARYAEATLRKLAGLLTLFDNHRIDHHAEEVLEIVICLGQFPAVYDDHALVHAHLRSSEATAVSDREGLLHVFEKFCNSLLVCEVYICVLVPENLRSI